MRPLATAGPDRHPNDARAFVREADVVLHELRAALAAILEQLRPPAMRASEFRRRLDLDQNLGWSLFNAATARDARTLASLLPGRRPMERFFAAAAGHGVPPGAIDRVRAAFERFEESVARHAGSRDAFETMVAELSSSGAEPAGGGADLRHKRAVFRGMSLLWGRQARVFCATKILHPSAGQGAAGLLDGVFIKGMVGLRRTRRSVPLHTAAHHWRTANPGDPAEPNPPEPLDPRETGPEAIGLLRDFCSQPLPRFRQRVSRQGYRSHELVNDELGAPGEVTYFTGEARRAELAAPGSVPGSEVMLFKAVDIPIEVFTGDILMHRSVWGTRAPKVQVYAFPLDGSPEFRDSDLLPLTERAEHLGEGIDAARTPLIPRYAEILSYAMERMGWNADEFRVFRCRVDYPVLYSRIRMTLR